MVEVTDADLARVRALRLDDEVLCAALAGFVAVHLRQVYRLKAKPRMVHEAFDLFVRAVRQEGLLDLAQLVVGRGGRTDG